MIEQEILSKTVLIATFLIGMLSGGVIFVIVGALNESMSRRS